MTKLTVDFGPESDKVLGDLASKKGTSKAEVLRRAISVYKYLNEQDGNQNTNVSITTKDGKVVKDIVVP